MDSSTFLSTFQIQPDEITYLIAHVGPLLKLLSEEYKGTGNAGDKLAQSYSHKATSCEILTSYAFEDILATIMSHFSPDSAPQHHSNQKRKKKRKNSNNPSTLARNNPAGITMAMPVPPGLGFEVLLPSKTTNNAMSEVLPAKKLAKVFLSHETKVWFRVVLAIFFSFPALAEEEAKETDVIDPTQDRFSLLSDSQKINLLKAYLRHNRGMNGNAQAKTLMEKRKNLIKTLKEALGGNHPCKLTLQDLLHFLSTSTKDMKATCDVLGLALFAPRDTRVLAERLPELKNRSQKLRETCAGLLMFLVENQSPVFNFRKRKFDADFNNALETLTFDELEEVRLSRLKQHLRHFFEIRDPPQVRSVGPLFEFYEFNDIATGIFAKYRILPYGWKQELEKSSADFSDGFDPFNNFVTPEMKSPAPVIHDRSTENDYNQLRGSYFEVDDTVSLHKSVNNTVLSMKLEKGQGSFSWLKVYLKNKKVKFLTEKTLTWPETSPVRIYAPAANNASKVDRIIDEFLEKQRELLTLLKAFQNYYVSEVVAIARGDLGPDAQNALGLNMSEVRTLFKSNFKEVISAQERFVNTLEPLLIVKLGQIKAPHTDYGRAGVLFKLFVKCERRLVFGYQHYNVGYKQKTDLLTQKREQVLAQVGFGRLTGYSAASERGLHDKKRSRNGRNLMKHLNFVQLFEEISHTKSALAANQLDSILLKPVQAVPRYKLFMERILGSLGADYPGRELGLEAIRVSENITKAVNENIRRQKDKLDRLLGREEGQ